MVNLQAKGFDALATSDTVAMLCTQEQVASNVFIPEQLHNVFALIDIKTFKAKPNSYYYNALKNKPAILLVGLGPQKDVTAETLRNAASTIIQACQDKGLTQIHIVVPLLTAVPDVSRCIAEGAFLSNYNFNRYKTNND